MNDIPWQDLGWALAGGSLIGISSVLLMFLKGRIAGISGITGGIFTPNATDRGWRALFVLGLLLGGGTLMALSPESIVPPEQPAWMVVLAGILVGTGVSLGNGCTSGHGVCGVSRMSIRSIIATCVFVGVGMVVASLVHGG